MKEMDETGYINKDWEYLRTQKFDVPQPATNRTGALIKNVIDPSSDATAGLLQNVYIANPQNVRSRFAAFDPMRRHEADLLASIAPWLLIGGTGALGAGLFGGGPGYD